MNIAVNVNANVSGTAEKSAKVQIQPPAAFNQCPKPFISNDMQQHNSAVMAEGISLQLHFYGAFKYILNVGLAKY